MSTTHLPHLYPPERATPAKRAAWHLEQVLQNNQWAHQEGWGDGPLTADVHATRAVAHAIAAVAEMLVGIHQELETVGNYVGDVRDEVSALSDAILSKG